jgi:NAD(P)H-hydrate repair Nnr-like enzyme with NAD(P)H-hydrate epimerase domain
VSVDEFELDGKTVVDLDILKEDREVRGPTPVQKRPPNVDFVDPAIISANKAPVSKPVSAPAASSSSAKPVNLPMRALELLTVKSVASVDQDSSAVETDDQSAPKRKKQPRKQGRKPRQQSDWEDADMSAYHEEEFDFQKNLEAFNKKKVFDEIRQTDSTDTSSLLVTSNRLPPKEKVSYAYNEMVTDAKYARASPRPADQWSDPERSVSRTKRPSYATTRSRQSRKSSATSALLSEGVLRVVADKTAVPTLTAQQFNMAEHLAASKYGPSLDALAENGARGVAQIISQILGHALVASPPVIVLLAGDTRRGEVALSAGRLLSILGVRCMALVSAANPINSVAAQLRNFANAGGRVVQPADLHSAIAFLHSPPALVLDALFDEEYVWDEEDREAAVLLGRWTEKQRAVVVSIDRPFENLQPQHLIALGLPRQDTVDLIKAGDLFFDPGTIHLIETGICRKIWREIGKSIVARTEFCTPLEIS